MIGDGDCGEIGGMKIGKRIKARHSVMLRVLILFFFKPICTALKKLKYLALDKAIPVTGRGGP
jgi:hypothetical protein